MRTYLCSKGGGPAYKKAAEANKMQALEAIKREDLQTLQQLVKDDISFTQPGLPSAFYAFNPLQFAVQKGNIALVKLLLTQKRIYIRSEEFYPALVEANSRKYAECAELIKHHQRIVGLEEERKKKVSRIKYYFDFMHDISAKAYQEGRGEPLLKKQKS